jgi:glycerate kinase
VRILVAPDKFKGVLSAREVGENIAAGLRDVLSNARIDIVPLADGGEGTAEVILTALGGFWVTGKAHDALGREIEARYGRIDQFAVMEMSEAAGMRGISGEKYDVDLASTFGVGEMILAAARQGAQEIIVGLGGSATNDGGLGMARALGFRFYEQEKELRGAVSELAKLMRIEKPGGLALPRIVVAADVKNPLLGRDGATRVFGPQKGVSAEKIDMFESALTRLADVTAAEFGLDHRNEPGAGAAGGVGFGLMSFCGARMRSGFEVVAEAVGLESKMEDVDLVITGEGSLDRQTLEGKTPAGVARLARKLGKPVYAMVGRADQDRQPRELFDGVFVATPGGMSEAEATAQATELLRERARELATKWLSKNAPR